MKSSVKVIAISSVAVIVVAIASLVALNSGDKNVMESSKNFDMITSNNKIIQGQIRVEDNTFKVCEDKIIMNENQVYKITDKCTADKNITYYGTKSSDNKDVVFYVFNGENGKEIMMGEKDAPKSVDYLID